MQFDDAVSMMRFDDAVRCEVNPMRFDDAVRCEVNSMRQMTQFDSALEIRFFQIICVETLTGRSFLPGLEGLGFKNSQGFLGFCQGTGF
jgi:hypothetical protein